MTAGTETDTPAEGVSGDFSASATAPAAKEPNFPGYKQPAGAIPGQRKGFTPEQLALAERVRQARRDFVLLLHEIGGTSPLEQGAVYATAEGANRFASRDLSLAFTHMEDAEYRAIKGLTGGPT